MGGMVIGLTVLPRPGDHPIVDSPSPRRLTLELDAHTVAKPPYDGLTKDTVRLVDGDKTAESSGNLGPTLLLTRGEPVAISVVNHTLEQTSVHWHGIALEDSYYDGGSGMGMAMHGERMSPPIDPGNTFIARFTPPDAGTFMYHAHMDDGWQLASGLDGPLIVLPAGERFDPRSDHVVMISESYEKAGAPQVAINGALAPSPIAMAAGTPQRLRLDGALTLGGENLVASLSDGSRVLRWTPVAKDGRDLPERLQREAVASQSADDRRNARLSLHSPTSGHAYARCLRSRQQRNACWDSADRRVGTPGDNGTFVVRPATIIDASKPILEVRNHEYSELFPRRATKRDVVAGTTRWLQQRHVVAGRLAGRDWRRSFLYRTFEPQEIVDEPGGSLEETALRFGHGHGRR